MQEIIEPGSVIGLLDDRICKLTGINKIPVIAVATHDTNSAIAAIPAKGDNWAFISSGTWSLMGIESRYPIINQESFLMNFTNEGGVCQTFDILKNHMGLWIVQQCKKVWKVRNYSYNQLIDMATEAEEFLGFIDVDDLSFLNPTNMCDAIAEYFHKTNQNIQPNEGQIIRIVLESLAFKYRETADEIQILTSIPIQEIFITGGGIKNHLLCQFTANATGLPVKAVLAEGASAGNIMLQAFGMGYVSSLPHIRETVRNSCDTKIYEPNDTYNWNIAFKKYKRIVGRGT
jgi:rhamnulokinase